MSALSQRQDRAAVLGALLLVQGFFGLHYLAAKLVLLEIPPRAWAAIRVVGAALVLLAAVRAMGRTLPRSPGDLGRLALFALLGVVINQVCFVEGLHRTTPTHSALINTTIPVGTLLFAVLLGRERLTWPRAGSLGVALAGVLLVIWPEDLSPSSETVAGDLLTLVNALSFALFLVVSKRLISRSDPIGATAVLLGFGAIGILAVGWGPLASFEPSTVSARTWWLGAFIILFATAGTYLLNYWALARVDSSVVALFIYLQPLIAAVLSWTLLGERIGASTAAGGALIFAGVYIAIRAPARSSQAAPLRSAGRPRPDRNPPNDEAP
jgi:drug/metabolite transporter (DMT)-like permease